MTETAKPTDPIRASQAKARPELPRRFYREVGFAPADGGFGLRLDGKPARSPGKAPLVVPNERLAQALAAEWDAQRDFITPAEMPLTRLVNTALDGVASHMPEVRADIVAYAGSDLLCYRVTEPDGLVLLQETLWTPMTDWARDELGANFVISPTISHIAQSDATLEAIDKAIVGHGPLALAALHSITTLTGSAILALATARRRLSAADAWEAAHVDEDWQISLWGEDAEASARRAARWREMQAASLVLVE